MAVRGILGEQGSVDACHVEWDISSNTTADVHARSPKLGAVLVFGQSRIISRQRLLQLNQNQGPVLVGWVFLKGFGHATDNSVDGRYHTIRSHHFESFCWYLQANHHSRVLRLLQESICRSGSSCIPRVSCGISRQGDAFNL